MTINRRKFVLGVPAWLVTSLAAMRALRLRNVQFIAKIFSRKMTINPSSVIIDKGKFRI